MTTQTQDRPLCPQCGHTMHRGIVRYPDNPVQRRQLWRCPMCGATKSTPVAEKE